VKPEGFKIFACMNPGFEVGKKPLPKRIHDCFTSFFIEPISSVEEIY
jgi:midasin (ATPase involved in ribosome maturation)